MKRMWLKLAAIAGVVLSLAGCSGGGSCSGCNTPTTPVGNLSLSITAPTQYPAGQPVAITANLTMFNTSTVNASNLVYTVPAAGESGNNTGVTITPNAGIKNGVAGACTNIGAGESCTFTATIGANAHPGSFTVTATPTSSTGQSATATAKALAAGSISVTANLGLVNIPSTQNSFYILPSDPVVAANGNQATLVEVSILTQSGAAAFDNLKLVDETGAVLNYTQVQIF